MTAFGVVKVVSRQAPDGSTQHRAKPLLTRILTIHENAPRLVGGLETAIGAGALTLSGSRWAGAGVTTAGVAFAVVLITRLRVMPDSGCGCLRAAAEDSYLSLSTVCRAAAVGLGGVCGLVASGSHASVAGAYVAGGVVWAVTIAVLSPELWRYLNLRCGRPLVLSAQDDRRRLERSPGYQRLRKAGLVGRRPADVWSEGCDRYFAFTLQGPNPEQFATFQVGPNGVLGRVISRPSSNDTNREVAQGPSAPALI
jgi:hypothetical protein